MPRLTFFIKDLDATALMRPPYLALKGFAEAGWEVDILTTATPGNANLDVLWDSVRVHKINGSSQLVRHAKLAHQLFRRRRGHVMLTWLWNWHCFALMAARLLFGSPYVVMLDTYLHHHPSGGSNRISILRREVRYGLIMRNADILLAETPAVRRYAQKYAPGPEVLLIPHSLWLRDLQAIEEQWREAGLSPERRPTILYTGRIVEAKHIHDLIEAFSRLVHTHPEWRLEIRGPITSSAYERSLRGQVRERSLDDRIAFEPFTTGEALYRSYRASSIYCLPSTGEGFPGTILEAMYFGGAIIASRAGCVDYQLDDGRSGLLFDPGDVDVLAQHLESLMTSPQARTQNMLAARERVVTMFTWERYFDLLETRMRNLAGG